MAIRNALLGTVLVGTVAAVSLFGFQDSEYDLLLAGGQIIDGTGNPWFRGDVGVRDGRIAAIGELSEARADRIIDAEGLTIVPGFIDLHSHAGDGALQDEDARRRAAPNLVAQGVTTLVANHDGRSPWPIRDQWAAIEQLGVGPNTLLLVGHGQLRTLVMGDDVQRAATPAEVDQMRALLREGIADGASGMSAGHEYFPMVWAETDEIVGLAEVVSEAQGVYIVHERSSGREPMWWWPSQHEPGAPSMIDAVEETIEVAERTGVTAVQTHMKARGAGFWGASEELVQLISEARTRGVSVWGDVYSYNTTGSDGSTVLIPRWVTRDEDLGPTPADRLETALADPSQAEDVRRDIAHEMQRRGGPENLLVLYALDQDLVGKTLSEVAASWGITPVEAALRLQAEQDREFPGGVRLRGFSLSEDDLDVFIRQPWMASASDAGVALPDDGFVHPRFYGNFPRKIHRFARQKGLLSIPDAIRSMTSLPAQILGIRDRGTIREGNHADLVVLDLDNLADQATALNPHQPPTGIPFVFVGGVPVVDEGKLTWALPGQLLQSARP